MIIDVSMNFQHSTSSHRTWAWYENFYYSYNEYTILIVPLCEHDQMVGKWKAKKSRDCMQDEDSQ